MSENNIIKLSFVGDIMCEKPLLNASKKKDGSYDFNLVFKHMKESFSQADYMVGNLETVCAGREYGYTDHIYNFNTPDNIIEAIKDSGIDMVATANNHCLDRGVQGLKRTNDLLDKYKIDHTGTFNSREDKEKLLVKDISGIKIAFLSYTYGTNTQINKFILDEENKYMVNLLQPQNTKIYSEKESKGIKDIIGKILFRFITVEQWIGLKRKLNMPYNHPRSDDSMDSIDEKYLKNIKEDIKKAKDQADYVIMCMHSGGQFNKEPGEFSKYMMKFMKENGVDFVVGSHPHIVQHYENINGMPGLYSLGNFNISPSSVYIIPDGKPEYGIMLHLYLNKEKDNTELIKASFTIIKMVEDKKGHIEVAPVEKLIKDAKSEDEKKELIKDNLYIYNRVLNSDIRDIDILSEYEIEL
ncbi:MAG TPA: CapA family protein [Tissierellales bacterium]|nr:CapA family protein [Tissierellales bacterium]